MLAELYDIGDLSLTMLLPVAGLVLGLIFGALAQSSRFCFRSAVIELQQEGRAPMAGAYLLALIVAVLGAQTLLRTDMVSFEETRFLSQTLPLGPLIFGGLIFGAGFILTRGCPSRLTVLTAQGNMRAGLVMVVFGITAYAAIRGIFAPLRASFASATSVSVPSAVLPDWAALVLLAIAVIVIWRSGVSLGKAIAGIGIGATVALGWWATGWLLQDSFDPTVPDSLAFTSGGSDAIFYLMVSTGIKPTFPAGVFAGVLLGAFLSAALRGELKAESFSTPGETARYLLGAVIMGIGAVWAGGCTIGAGLTGGSTLSVAALIAITATALGALVANQALNRRPQPAIA